MNYSIQQLIEIYEQELSTLIQGRPGNSQRPPLTQISIPRIGDPVQLSNQNFTVSAVERFKDASRPRLIDDFLNEEDRQIINDLETEGDLEIPQDGEFDDDPYPELENTIGADWDISGEDEINLTDDEAGYLEEGGAINWKEPDSPIDRETTIAYYRSFHQAGYAFGIYFKKDGLKTKTRILKRFCIQHGYGISIEQAYVIAKMMTQYHEIYHHKIEAIASRIEVISRMPIYLGGFSAWYNRTRNQAMCYEETFANVYAYRKTKNALKAFLPLTALHNLMVHWFNQQPTPYRNALRLINKSGDLQRNRENQFFEIILNKFFPADPRYGKMNANVWNLFTHGTHPYINTNSNVYYII